MAKILKYLLTLFGSDQLLSSVMKLVFHQYFLVCQYEKPTYG
jgi:hypothetical protein